MTFNWDNIKYLFQIPVEWFKAIHNKVFKAYGTNFIEVKEDDSDGGLHIDVNEELFKQMVDSVIEPEEGTVKSVDNVLPDNDGNVELNAVKSVDNVTPDADGNVQLNAVASVDGVEPDANGNVQLDAVKSVNSQTPDSNGNVEVDVGVKTIDNTSPDQYGNINLSYAKSVNNYFPDQYGNITVPGIDPSTVVLTTDINREPQGRTGVAGYYYANIAYTGNLPGGLDNLYDWVGAYDYDTLQEKVDTFGYLKQQDLSGLVRYVNTIPPDANGNVNLGNLVKSVESQNPDANGNVKLTGFVKSVNSETPDPTTGDVELDVGVLTINNDGPDANGNYNITGYAKSVNGETPDPITGDVDVNVGVLTINDEDPDPSGNYDIDVGVLTINGEDPVDGNYDITGYAKSVDGHNPDTTTGAVSFNLAASKWLMSDNQGHIVTTNDTPIVPTSSSNGYLYATNGVISYQTGGWVDLTNNQTVGGQKTWTDAAYFKDYLNCVWGTSPNTYGITLYNPNDRMTEILMTGTANIIQFGSGNGSDYILNSSIGTQVTSGGTLRIEGASEAIVAAPVNKAQLTNSPNANAGNLAIATVGWAKNQNYVKSVNNTTPDQNGNVTIQTVDPSTVVLQSDINVEHQGRTAVAGYYYANIKYTGNLPGGLSNLYQWVGAFNYNTLDDEITALGYVKDSDLGDLAYLDNVVVDGHTSDSSGNVSFNLAGSKWVKTDANGHLTTTNETPVSVDTTQYTPQNAVFNFVKNVTWNGTSLQRVVCSLRFVNGILVTVGNDVTETIDTAVTYNP